jgi:4-hydroxy-tetrahydrodipicolinate synthase
MIPKSAHPLAGVYAAALTPLNQDHDPDLAAIPELLNFLAKRGCHGALLLGTTGEGPSFSEEERLPIFQAALEVRQIHPDFRLLAGTGTPNLPETIRLTKAAFDLGFEGVVVLPPYYYHQAGTEGLYGWFCEVIERAVPKDGYLFGYHIPAQSRVPLPLDLLTQLKDTFPDQFAGIKDSSSDPHHAELVGQRFGNSLTVLTGNDSLMTYALEHHASGCITALANLFSPDLRLVWDAHQQGEKASEAQSRLNAYRTIMSQYTPYPPSIKALLPHFSSFPHWPVRLPLRPLALERTQQALEELSEI